MFTLQPEWLQNVYAYLLKGVMLERFRVEALAPRTNIVAVTTKFSYEHILTRFGCPLTFVTDQGTHFINYAIKYLTNHFILRLIL